MTSTVQRQKLIFSGLSSAQLSRLLSFNLDIHPRHSSTSKKIRKIGQWMHYHCTVMHMKVIGGQYSILSNLSLLWSMLFKSHLNVILDILLFWPCTVLDSNRKWLVTFGIHLSQREVNCNIRSRQEFSYCYPPHPSQVSPWMCHLGWMYYEYVVRKMSLQLNMWV